MKILVADDEALNRRITAATLSRAGHEVVAVDGGAAAVEAAAAAAFDLILLDVQMPDVDGPAAARAIRAAGARMPIVALSASLFAADVETCRAAGMNAFIGKPLSMDALDEALRGGSGAAATAADDRLLDADRLAALAEDLPPTLLRASIDACLLSLDQSAATLADAADRAAVAAVTHKIAGTAATYGLAALRAAALAAEAAAKAPDAALDAPVARVKELLPFSRAALERYAAAP